MQYWEHVQEHPELYLTIAEYNKIFNNQKGNLMNDQVNTEVPQFDIPLELRRKAGEPVPIQTEADKGKDATVIKP